jgi:hypothetical protein
MTIIKTFPPQGDLQLVRHDALHVFVCTRCGDEKKSKLVASRIGEPDKPLCNGCYGLLLSKK